MISEKGIALISKFEGCRLNAYPDPATGCQPYTIGYGHTGGVTPSDICTPEQATDWLKEDCKKAEDCIDANVEIELNQNQRDALISFIFNLGCQNFKNSTLLKLINAGKFEACPAQFRRWNRANGKEMAGLTKRREAEANLFMEVM